MARRILHVQDGRTSVSQEARFETERDLELAIAEHPEVLPCEDFGLGSLVALGTQLDFGSGPIDLLAADANGRLAIVEFKRGTENPDVRRVVAQLLDYGSSLWRLPYSDLVAMCGRPLFEQAIDLESVMAEGCAALGIPFDSEAFRVGIEGTLDSGDFVFLYVGRDLDDRSRRIMTYLAEGPRMNFFAVEVDHYREPQQDRAVLVPRASFIPSWVSGTPAAPRSASRMSTGLAGAAPDTLKLIQLMDEVAQELGLTIKQSRTGRNYEPLEHQPGAKHTSGIGVYATSRGMELNLQVFRDLGASEAADDLLERLRTNTGIAVTAANWPAVPCDAVVRAWPQARTELIEPYFHARARLRETATST